MRKTERGNLLRLQPWVTTFKRQEEYRTKRLCTFTKIFVGRGMPSLISFVFSLNSLQNWLIETPRYEEGIKKNKLSVGIKGSLSSRSLCPVPLRLHVLYFFYPDSTTASSRRFVLKVPLNQRLANWGTSEKVRAKEAT